MDIQQLIEQDQELTLQINGSHSVIMDNIMSTITSTWVWIPWAVVLLYVFIHNNSWRGTLLALLFFSLTILVADQITSGFCKPFFHRFRPTQDPHIMYLIDVVQNYRGGRFGFMSSHAANTFGVFAFTSLLIRQRGLSFVIFLWAALNSYSRIYLGVHYLGDVLCGATVGCLSGLLLYCIYQYLTKRIGEHYYQQDRSVSEYTRSGYLLSDTRILILFFNLICCFIILKAIY